jgi:hypothetical protein
MARSFESRFREPTTLDDEDRLALRFNNLEAQIVVAAAANQFLTTSEFDDTDATYYFYGGLTSASAWQINRYTKAALVRTSAALAGNPTKTSLASAWTDRLTLTYS